MIWLIKIGVDAGVGYLATQAGQVVFETVRPVFQSAFEIIAGKLKKEEEEV